MTTLAPRGSHAAISWRPLDPIDRSWSGVAYVRSFLDLDVPDVAAVRAAVRDLAVESTAIGRWTTATPPQWRPVSGAELDGWLDRTVVGSGESAVSVEHSFDVNAEPLGDLPFRLVVGADWVSVRMTHAMGDGYTVNAFVGHVLRRAASAAPVSTPWAYIGSKRRDRMIVRDVITRPGALLRALRHRKQLAGGTYEPITARASAMVELSVGLVSGPEFPRVLREIRDELAPSASAAAVAMVGLRAAFATTLPEPRAGFECLFNTRSKDAGTTNSWGNWSVGVYIHPADDYSPVATSAEMARVRDSGLPQLAAASLRARARTSSGDTVSVVAPEGAPRLTLSYTQQHAMDKIIPGQRPGRSLVATLTRPNGVETITVQAVELADRLSVSISFYPDVWPLEDVERAVRMFLDDPRSTLRSARWAERE